jgi:hypothetical protein
MTKFKIKKSKLKKLKQFIKSVETKQQNFFMTQEQFEEIALKIRNTGHREPIKLVSYEEYQRLIK